MTDSELISAIAAGQQDALAALYDRYAALLLAIGLRILNRREDAEDVAHDVFIEVWKCAGDYQPQRSSVRTWLSIRMRSRCIDRRRRADFSRTDSLSSTGADGETGGSRPGREPTSDPVERPLLRLDQVLDTMPASQSEVIRLGYFAGLSCSEIAERLRIPVGTVKSRLSAGMKKLRVQFAAAPEETR